jgi:hypothetical protein
VPTSGPDGDGGVTNIGVAAHISAASPGGARYDETLTPEMRSDFANGIWLCQSHAKLIDDDELAYTVAVLRDWKETAEHMAALEARGYAVRKARPFPALEKKAPQLLAEMREDLKREPLVREFILLMSKRVAYNPGPRRCFRYYYDEHEYLGSIITIMEHAGAIYDIAFNSVPRYNFAEEFVSYLIGDMCDDTDQSKDKPIDKTTTRAVPEHRIKPLHAHGSFMGIAMKLPNGDWDYQQAYERVRKAIGDDFARLMIEYNKVKIWEADNKLQWDAKLEVIVPETPPENILPEQNKPETPPENIVEEKNEPDDEA